MDFTGQWRTYINFLFHFLVLNTISSHESSSTNRVNSSSKTQRADIVLGQHRLPPWYHTSGDAVDAAPKHGAGSSHSPNRWRTQMAFSKSVYSFEVKENTVPGTVVGKVKTVQESLTPITYSVQEDDGENLFLLNPHSGEFLLSRALDFETHRFYILSVVAQQGDSQVSSVRVYFNVLDVNDNPPVFSQDIYSASLLEDTHAGTCFLSLNVSDKDGGDNGDFDLKVVSRNEDNIFWVNPSGVLCLNSELDRERRSFYNLTLTASDRAQPVSLQLTSSAHVIIVVDDVNDNVPSFVSARTVSVPEDAALHSVVATLHAEDADVGSNGEVLYYLNDTAGGVFSIDNISGNLYLQQILDREQVDVLSVTVTATDKGSPPLAASMSLTVHVEDVNDHGPEFSQSNYSLTVREDILKGMSLFQVQAHDLDIGANGRVRYVLSQRGPFEVDTVRGVITVMDNLDRERESSYTLIIMAVDQGDIPRSATAVISVTVLDVNDFTPVFSPALLTIHVLENEEDLSQLTHQISALDEDEGVNSELTYLIQQGNGEGLFSLSPNGTFQILHSLDRERESLYIITIIAVDSGLPPLTGTATIQVIVDDVNDNRPVFFEDVYNTIVFEDSSVGTVFAMVTASDMDEGVSGEIRYFIENVDAPFSIEETSGELFTTDVLDRESVAIYRLMVIGSDRDPTHPLSSSVLVTVVLEDINDHWPQFLNKPYVAYVPTEMASGSVVCVVKATDGDTEMNAELQFSLYGQNADLFSISPHSDIVFTSGALRGSEDITINVHVEDSGEDPKFDFTTISVRFQNASDFPRMHVDVLRNSLPEDEPVGTLVAVVSATSPRAGPVSFYVASGNFEEMFHMHQLSGNLTLENPLDFENAQDFTLLIEVRDSGSPPFSSFAEIHLNISDVNDNFPQFTQVEYRCEVIENSPPTWVCDVLAIDPDSGSYGVVQYNITDGNIDNVFAIDPESGVLSTTASLDREYIPEYNLTVESMELDNPLHKDRATVIIIILDRNDNAPRFSQIIFTELPEDTPVGHRVIQVISTDDDTPANAVITYSIIEQSDDIPFSIDITSGYITVVRPLDREMQDHYIVKVNANDSAWSVSTDVTIVITDINDNQPIFFSHSYTIALPETEDQEVFVMQVLATDADIGQNGQILYFIEPPNEQFWVNASSGDIYTKQPMTLHHPGSEIFCFIVFAYDCGNVPFHSNTTVTVRLEPYNHYPPVFLPLQPLMAIPYDIPIGSEVLQLVAIDQDFNNSSTDIEYVLNGGNASDFFWIQADSGKVTLNQSLNESVSVVFTLSFVAKDQGFPPLSSQTEITFEITGRNQFSPSFSESDVSFSVPEDLPVSSVIGKIQAEDGDYGANGVLRYCIMPENQYIPFSVGKDSGLLTLIRDLDFEEEGIYHLQIKAMDGGWVPKTGMLNITVIVMDVNDNPPVFSTLEYIASVPESSAIGTTVLHVKATDADSGANGQITYFLTGGYVDKFAIDSRNGTVTTMDVFDYEHQHIFDISIKATNDGGHPLFSVAHMIIQILDVNEFTPTFTSKEFSFSVFTNAPIGTNIGKVTATDFDQGSEGRVLYLMFGQSKYMGFEIDGHSGEIFTTGSLRKRGNSRTALKVLAKNTGVITGMDVDEALVQISIIDTNDAPKFTSALYLTNVTEDSKVGTSVITVSAQDLDSILEWNRFFFSIENGNTNSSFVVDPSSGIISVNLPLDREQWPIYNLTVTATDYGSPPATGSTNVVVTISDINDNSPKLAVTEAQVKENQPQGTIVARLNASDSDSPPNQGPFTYWFVRNSVGSTFSLTPDGVLFTTRPIDREQNSVFLLLVAVRDAGTPPLSSTATVQISVVDENDNPSVPRNIFIEVKYFGSSFQGGMIGNVRPEDRDETDTYNCSIRSGPLNMFTIPYGTCELWSLPFQGEATYNITIEATDQLHVPVNNSVYVNYKGFTNASMDNCILFYMSSSSMEEFLSHKYLRFVKALDSLFNLQASKTHVFGIKLIGTDFLLLAAVKNYNGQYLGREVARGISAGHKKLLEAQSNVTISHITSDPCFTNPCQNGATCSKNIHIGQDVAVLESVAVIFVSPQKEIFNCTCSAGFTGTLCEADIDECVRSPCENGGTCVNNPGSFNCHCQSGFSGSVCSTDVDECLKVRCQNGGVCVPTYDGFHCLCAPGYKGEICEHSVDHCESSPCVHGSCINFQTGFSCDCPFGVGGVHCEEFSYGFEELSFMEFPPLDRRSNLISLELATVQSNSLLLYNPGGPSSREFFALEILDGAVHFSYDLGSGPVRLETKKQVADGHFHSITARRIGNMGSLHVDTCTDVENNGFCFAQHDGSSAERTLDVGSVNVTVGGLRTIESVLLHPAQIKTHDFIGCIRNVHINGIHLRPSMALATYNILERCPRASVSLCHSSPCKNGGVCHDLWSHYLCKCKSPFGGSSCATEMSEEVLLRLGEGDYVEYVIKERFKRDYLLRYLVDDEINKETNARDLPLIDIKFKTKENGVLMFVLGRSRYTVLWIKDRKPMFMSKDTTSGQLSEFTVNTPVTDGLWHVLTLFSNAQSMFLLLDEKPVLNTTDKSLELIPVSVDKIVLGAAPHEDPKLQQSAGISGCVEYFKVMGYTLPVSGYSEMVEVWPSSTLVQPSCTSPGFCVPLLCSEDDGDMKTCLSAHCQNQGRCPHATPNGSCICLYNVSEQACDACTSMTENNYQCSEAPQGTTLLWLIAVILPVFSVMTIICLFCATNRVRRHKSKGHGHKCSSDISPQMTEQAADNVAFCFDDSRRLADAVPAEGGAPHEGIGADKHKSSVEFYCDASLSTVQAADPNSELEYYEIGSICSAFHSDTASLKLSWHKHLYGTKHVKANHKGMADFHMLLAGVKKDCSDQERKKPPTNPKTFASPSKQLLTKFDSEQRQSKQAQHAQPCYMRTFFKPEIVEPVQCLSVEEIRQLNTPLEQTDCCNYRSCQAALRPGSGKSSKIIDISSDSETDSTFTCSESEYGHFSVNRDRKFTHDQSSLSACSFRQQGIFPMHSVFKHPEGLHQAESTPSGTIEHWENILNMHLNFSTFAEVFEDIACLPMKRSHDCDMQSDLEEMI